MSKTPLVDFIGRYAECGSARFHMPGHKGKTVLGFEPYDLTEFDGADDLFEPDGVIAESEANASRLFGCPTYYSAGGSTLMIQAMLALAVGRGGKVAAGRNAHKSLLNTAILLDLEITWLYQHEADPDIACTVTADDVEEVILREHPSVVYLTSPDYLGNVTDIAPIAEVCHRYGVWLLVDNAHGAYLKFLPDAGSGKSAECAATAKTVRAAGNAQSGEGRVRLLRHPIELGADMCCDSAHKTLPVVTGGAYLHLSEKANDAFGAEVKNTMALFGSTSPSYLIMASLDAANPYLEQLPGKLQNFIPKIDSLKASLLAHGWNLVGIEPLKITLETRSFGYTGDEIAELLIPQKIFTEFHDPEFIVFMVTPENTDEELERLEDALCAIERRVSIAAADNAAHRTKPEIAMKPRDAWFAPSETVDVEHAAGRVLSSARIGCPPAIPLVMAGEVIDANCVERMKYYGTTECRVVKKQQ